MPNADTVLQQRLLERKRAPDHKGDKIIPPVLRNVIRFIEHFAVAKNAISRHVSSDVKVIAKFWKVGIAYLGYSQQWAWFWIVEAEAVEVSRQLGGKNGNIALNIVRR
jgi:hypothetical protein